MYSVCYFGPILTKIVIFERFRDKPQILTSVKICSVLSHSGTCIRRDTTKLLVFFHLGMCLKKKNQMPTHFHSSCQFRNPNISSASKLVTDVACGTDSHTWQERRKGEEIQEEQGTCVVG